jgi:hypothetical protein
MITANLNLTILNVPPIFLYLNKKSEIGKTG